MSIKNIFNKIFSNSSQEALSNEEIESLVNMIKSNKAQINEWDKMFGILSFNIWHNSSQDFIKSNKTQDIEIPFLCSIGVIQSLKNTAFSKKFDFSRMTSMAPQNVINSKNELQKQLPAIKQMLNQITSQNNIETIKPFTTVFAQGFLSDFKKSYSGNNPLEYFQKGLEVLYIFIHELQYRDETFYEELSDYGEYQSTIESIIEELNAVI